MLDSTHLIKIADATGELSGTLMSVVGCPEKGALKVEMREGENASPCWGLMLNASPAQLRHDTLDQEC